jgi:hypothetical protein
VKNRLGGEGDVAETGRAARRIPVKRKNGPIPIESGIVRLRETAAGADAAMVWWWCAACVISFGNKTG